MEWFKHKTAAHQDPVISDAWDKFGDAAYVVWFVLLEIYGEQYKPEKPDKPLDVSKAFLRRKFRKSWGKVEQILNFYQKTSKLRLEINQTRVLIQIPRFTEILSNWTGRRTRAPTEQPTETPTEQPLPIDKDKDKESSSYTSYSAERSGSRKTGSPAHVIKYRNDPFMQTAWIMFSTPGYTDEDFKRYCESHNRDYEEVADTFRQQKN